MPEFGPSRGSLAEDVPLDGRLEDDLTSDAQSDISILEEDDLLTKIKPKSRRRRAVYVAVAAIVAVLVLMACLTIPSGKAPPRLLLLQLQGESELSQLSRAISCPPGACTLLESSAFAGVNGGLWLVSMDTDRSPVQASFSKILLQYCFCPGFMNLAFFLANHSLLHVSKYYSLPHSCAGCALCMIGSYADTLRIASRNPILPAAAPRLHLSTVSRHAASSRSVRAPGLHLHPPTPILDSFVP